MSSGIFSDGLFSIYANTGHSKYKIFDLIETIPTVELSKEKIEQVLKEAKIDVRVNINEVKEENFLQYHIVQLLDICPKCKKRSMGFAQYCGANVCASCGYHKGLAMCFCGWNVKDDVDRAQMGMNEDAKYLGDGEWEVNY